MLEHCFAETQTPERVVVIGAAGFVGQNIEKVVRSEGIETLPLGRREIDLLASDADRKLRGILKSTDSVVFISAKAPARNVPMLMENLRMAEQVCTVLAEQPIAHLLYISSDAIYSDDANPVTESSYVAPSTIHGMMHAAREMMLRNSTKAPVAMLRPTLIYGAGDPHSGYGPNRFRREAETGGPIHIFGEGEERRDHVAVEDVAALALLILGHRSHGALNAATGAATSFHDIAHELARLYGTKVESQPRPGPRPHLMHRHFDIAGCQKAFPRFRFTALPEGLRRLHDASGPSHQT